MNDDQKIANFAKQMAEAIEKEELAKTEQAQQEEQEPEEQEELEEEVQEEEIIEEEEEEEENKQTFSTNQKTGKASKEKVAEIKTPNLEIEALKLQLEQQAQVMQQLFEMQKQQIEQTSKDKQERQIKKLQTNLDEAVESGDTVKAREIADKIATIKLESAIPQSNIQTANVKTAIEIENDMFRRREPLYDKHPELQTDMHANYAKINIKYPAIPHSEKLTKAWELTKKDNPNFFQKTAPIQIRGKAPSAQQSSWNRLSTEEKERYHTQGQFASILSSQYGKSVKQETKEQYAQRILKEKTSQNKQK